MNIYFPLHLIDAQCENFQGRREQRALIVISQDDYRINGVNSNLNVDEWPRGKNETTRRSIKIRRVTVSIIELSSMEFRQCERRWEMCVRKRASINWWSSKMFSWLIYITIYIIFIINDMLYITIFIACSLWWWIVKCQAQSCARTANSLFISKSNF